jgi:hypothetical protein
MVKADLTRDYYGDLEVPANADANEIKKQFKKLGMDCCFFDPKSMANARSQLSCTTQIATLVVKVKSPLDSNGYSPLTKSSLTPTNAQNMMPTALYLITTSDLEETREATLGPTSQPNSPRRQKLPQLVPALRSIPHLLLELNDTRTLRRLDILQTKQLTRVPKLGGVPMKHGSG